MDQQLSPAELLRFLQAEAGTLEQLQAKISNELHHLQVEEEIYVRTLDRLKQNAGTDQSNSTNGNAREDTRGSEGLELLEALHQELASAVRPVSMLPPDSAPPTATHSAITETEPGKDAKVESQLAVPSEGGFHDHELEEYELLDALESGKVKL